MTKGFAVTGSRLRRWQVCSLVLEVPSILLTPVARVAAAAAAAAHS